jgi:hypothetical protein
MTHPHLDQRNFPVYQHPMVFTPYQHLVNAPVSPLDSHTSALIPQHYSEPPTVVDGEVITSSRTTRTMVRDDTEPTTGDESRPSLLRRAIDDPYWILMTLMAVLGLSITATVVYGVIQIILAIGSWFHAHGATLVAIAALIIVLMLCGGGASAAKCTGIHCGGCKG